jgi:hypothetical protein
MGCLRGRWDAVTKRFLPGGIGHSPDFKAEPRPKHGSLQVGCKDCKDLRSALSECVEALGKAEWGGEGCYCPVCGMMGKHAKDCELAAALESARKVTR